MEEANIEDIVSGIVGRSEPHKDDHSDQEEINKDAKVESDSKTTEETISEEQDTGIDKEPLVETADSQDKTSDSKKAKKGGKGFKFDKDKYPEITDPKALEALEKAEKRIWEKDKLIGTQGQRLGDSKKDREYLEQELHRLSQEHKPLTDNEYDELHEESPSQARKAALQDEKFKQEINDKMQELNRLKMKDNITTNVKDFEDLLPEVVDLLRQDHPAPEQQSIIDAFSRDPFGPVGPTYNEVMSYVKIAQQNRRVIKMERQINDLTSSKKQSLQSQENFRIDQEMRSDSFGRTGESLSSKGEVDSRSARQYILDNAPSIQFR